MRWTIHLTINCEQCYLLQLDIEITKTNDDYDRLEGQWDTLKEG